jgi:hypothetical protein
MGACLSTPSGAAGRSVAAAADTGGSSGEAGALTCGDSSEARDAAPGLVDAQRPAPPAPAPQRQQLLQQQIQLSNQQQQQQWQGQPPLAPPLLEDIVGKVRRRPPWNWVIRPASAGPQPSPPRRDQAHNFETLSCARPPARPPAARRPAGAPAAAGASVSQRPPAAGAARGCGAFGGAPRSRRGRVGGPQPCGMRHGSRGHSPGGHRSTQRAHQRRPGAAAPRRAACSGCGPRRRASRPARRSPQVLPPPLGAHRCPAAFTRTPLNAPTAPHSWRRTATAAPSWSATPSCAACSGARYNCGASRRALARRRRAGGC